MLRIRRLTQLLIALCASAFLSALISLVIYRVLSMTVLPLSGQDIVNDIRSIEDINKLKEVTVTFLNAAFDLRDSGVISVKWGLGFVLVWSAVIGSVAFATYRQICRVSIAPDALSPEVENFVDRALAGSLELWKVFWGGYVAVSLLLLMTSGGILKFLTQIGSGSKSLFLFNVLAGPIALSIPITIYLLCALLVWRSASNTSSVAWHYLAKAVVVACTVVPLIKGIYVTSTILLAFG
jgi:hypothetical protein